MSKHTSDGGKRDQRDIHCPQCSYRPQPEDRWSCMPTCGTVFHTFWTGGLCPGCGYTWTQTQCPACGKLSPHRAWYHEPQPQAVEVRELHESFD